MRLSCAPILFFKEIALERTMCLEDWFQLAASLGFDGTEIHHNSLLRFDRQYLHHIADAVSINHLAVSQFISATDFTNPVSQKRDREIQTLKKHIDIASLFEASCIRITAGQEYPDVPREQSISWVIECFRECLEYSDKRGVWLAYENHYKDYFWERPDFSMKHEIYLEIIDRLEDTSLKVNFDCANPIMVGEDPLTILEEVLDRVVHVHCSDRAIPFEYTHSVSGEGRVDFRSIFEMLNGAGWDGWLSVEYNGVEGIEGLERSAKYIRKTWQEV